MPVDPKRWAVGQRPANARLIPPEERQTPAKPQEALMAAKVQSRHRLGPPLDQAQPQAGATGQRTRVPRRTVAALLGGAALLASTGLMASGWLQAVAVAGAVSLWAWGAWPLRSRPAAPGLPRWTPDRDALTALDAQMVALAPELPEPLLQALANTKAQLRELLRLAQLQAPGVEDGLWLQACVSRYLPDSLRAYEAVPVKLRDEATSQSLLEQLGLLQERFQRLEQALAAGATEALQSQHRFLRAKSGR
ncbi:MAG: hypothetical protein ACK5O3_04600 [Burkholderiales bacterium]